MVWAIVDDGGDMVTETVADHPHAAWHRYVQSERAVDREDAVTKVLAAQERGFTCERLLVEDAGTMLTQVVRRSA